MIARAAQIVLAYFGDDLRALVRFDSDIYILGKNTLLFFSNHKGILRHFLDRKISKNSGDGN